MQRQQIYCFTAGIVTCLTLLTLKRLAFDTTYSPLYGNVLKKKAVFFGDSITQHGSNVSSGGWVARLAEYWTRRVDCINRGFSGYNTAWAVSIAHLVVIPEKPDLIFLFFGANDAVDISIHQHVPLKEFEANLQSLVDLFKQKLPAAQVVLITPPPVDEQKLGRMNAEKGKTVLVDRTNERTLLYVQAVKALGAKQGLPVVDAWTAMGGASPLRANYLLDGLHLNDL
ncbi:SGNH hydrolase-type esterase domain-containing protein [Ochromonadaceae sp. CCMP2298]|nr:SGNH hydrolase-type esterase domain-containing protein [Ochromonadaceae sp. CCMP2298]